MRAALLRVASMARRSYMRLGLGAPGFRPAGAGTEIFAAIAEGIGQIGVALAGQRDHLAGIVAGGKSLIEEPGRHRAGRLAHLLLGEEVPGACRFVDGIIEAVAKPHADGAVDAGRIGSPAIGIGFRLLRRGVRTAGFHRLLLFQRPAGARLQLLDLRLEPARFGVELLASLDAGIVGGVFAARLLHIAPESVELAQLAGDGGVKRRHGPRRRLLPGHCLGRHLDHAIKRDERRKQRTGE